MNGKVLPLLSDKLKEEGRAEGKIEVFLNMLDRGFNLREAQAITELSDELVETALKQQRNALNKK